VKRGTCEFLAAAGSFVLGVVCLVVVVAVWSVLVRWVSGG
jgi:hypothetical protein